ncbi:MAG: FliG C-terminal domain-containing protein [bacterium]
MDINDLTPKQKTAILLASLPPEVSRTILEKFPKEEIRTINLEIAKVRNLPESLKQQVIKEFLEKNNLKSLSTIGNIKAFEEEKPKEEGTSISQNLDKLLGKTNINQNVSNIGQNFTQTSSGYPNYVSYAKSNKPLDFLAAINPKKVYWVLRNESNNVIAFILYQLPPAVSQRILSVFPTSQQAEINKHLVNIKNTNPKVLEVIAKFLKEELDEVNIELPNIDSTPSTSTNVNITQNTNVNPIKTVSNLASITISNKKFEFSDIAFLKTQDMEQLMRLTNPSDWISALKGVDPEVAEKILSIMPITQAKIIKKELVNSTASKDDIIKSQRDILFKLKGLVTIGKIKI